MENLANLSEIFVTAENEAKGLKKLKEVAERE